jgi:hypothetical protein
MLFFGLFHVCICNRLEKTLFSFHPNHLQVSLTSTVCFRVVRYRYRVNYTVTTLMSHATYFQIWTRCIFKITIIWGVTPWSLAEVYHQTNQLTNYLINSMELSPSWETNNCSGTREIPSNVWKLKVHYCIHKSPPLVSILSQITPVQIPSYFSKIHFNVIRQSTCTSS